MLEYTIWTALWESRFLSHRRRLLVFNLLWCETKKFTYIHWPNCEVWFTQVTLHTDLLGYHPVAACFLLLCCIRYVLMQFLTEIYVYKRVLADRNGRQVFNLLRKQPFGRLPDVLFSVAASSSTFYISIHFLVSSSSFQQPHSARVAVHNTHSPTHSNPRACADLKLDLLLFRNTIISDNKTVAELAEIKAWILAGIGSTKNIVLLPLEEGKDKRRVKCRWMLIRRQTTGPRMVPVQVFICLIENPG